MIRKSKLTDKELIQQLMQLCFSDKNNFEPYENLEDRYYLYFKDNTLVAMSGLTSNSEYGHLEIDWTCTHPEHRHNDYMQELFTEMLNGIQELVYCSCWRLPNNDRANLHTLMSLFGFKKLYNQEYIGKYHIIVFVIMKVVVCTVQVLIVNAMKICFYGRNDNVCINIEN